MTTAKASASTVRSEMTIARKRWGWTPSDVINLLRRSGNPGKGSGYERELCKKFSLWWTGGARDDVFWRSSGSGARAKVRGHRGTDTMGQHGDVSATDPIGLPLIDVFTIEIKRGYSEFTIQDLIDRTPTAGVQEWERFLAQTIESYEQAGSFSWLMITRRDRREALAWTPMSTIRELRRVGAFHEGHPTPSARIRVSLRDSNKRHTHVDVYGMVLDDWLHGVKPRTIVCLSNEV